MSAYVNPKIKKRARRGQKILPAPRRWTFASFCTRRAESARAAHRIGKFFDFGKADGEIGRHDELGYAFARLYKGGRVAVIVQSHHHLAAVVAVHHPHFIGRGKPAL